MPNSTVSRCLYFCHSVSGKIPSLAEAEKICYSAKDMNYPDTGLAEGKGIV